MKEINKRNARIWSMSGSRGTYGMAINDLAEDRDDFVVMSADLANSSGLKQFIDRFPDRFYDIGIAEQNMITIAAGYASEGIPVFASSFAPFVTMRCCEQIRMDLAYMNNPVIVVGLCGGFEQGTSGNSHYGLEDIAVMRCIPNMTVVSPSDGASVYKAVYAALEYKKPIYLRLTGSANFPIVYTEDFDFVIGKGNVVKSGEDLAIIASGTMVGTALKCSQILNDMGIDAEVIDMHTIKPIDEQLIKRCSEKFKLIITIEEHSICGGLGTAVSEVIASNPMNKATVYRFGASDSFEKAGRYEWLINNYGLTADSIVKRILSLYNN